MNNNVYRLAVGTLIAGTLALADAQAQAPSDGYRNSLEGVHGTARAQSMSNAVGALGADPTAIWINPAGSALYRRSILSMGMDAGMGRASADYRHAKGTETVNTHYGLFNFNNVTYVGAGSGLAGVPIRFSWSAQYNRDYSYARRYTLSMPEPDSSITDYLALKANQSGAPSDRYYLSNTYDPRYANVNQSVVMGLNGWLIEGKIKGKPNDFYRPNVWAWEGDPEQSKQVFLLPSAGSLSVKETGGKNSLELNLGLNYDDLLFFGATIRATSSRYTRHSEYSEGFYYAPKDNKMEVTYDNDLSVTGSAVALNLGALVAAGDYGRIGIAYLLPQYASYSETYGAASSYYNNRLDEGFKDKSFDTGGDFTSGYAMWLPGKLTLSAMAFLGRYGMVTYDFTYRNLGSAKYMLPNENSSIALEDVTNLNSRYFGNQYRHSLGLELRMLDRLSLRAGYSYESSGIRDQALAPSGEKMGIEYSASGMILDYTLPRSSRTASAGMGFRLGDMTLDLAYVYSVRNEGVYPYPALPTTELKTVTGGAMKDVRHRVAATVTIRF